MDFAADLAQKGCTTLLTNPEISGSSWKK